MKTNVVFEYAGENMETVHDKVAVTGEITDCGFAVMMAATNRDGVFVPAAVGLRKVNYAKLVGVEPCEADSDAVCSADVLVGRFVNASGAWDELSSNRQVQSGAVRVGIPFVYGLYNFTPVRNGANKKISWWISREGIGHALYCFTANYTPEIGYQFQHISNYISMFEEQFGTPDGKPKSKKAPVGGRNVAVVRIKVYPDVGPAYIVEVPSDEIGSIDKWAREHLENWTCVEQKDSNSAPEASPSPEIGYQFQYISNVGGRNVDAIRFKVYPNVGPAYIVEVPSGEVDNIDEWLSEHMESDATFVELKSTDSTSKNTSSDENADIRVRDICGDKCQCYVYYDKASGQNKMRFWLRAAFPRPADMIEVRTALKANFGSGAGTHTYDDGSFDVIIQRLVPFAFSNADLESFADNAVTLIENVLHAKATSVSWNAGHCESDDDALLTEKERSIVSRQA
jgi:hypothetical protein